MERVGNLSRNKVKPTRKLIFWLLAGIFLLSFLSVFLQIFLNCEWSVCNHFKNFYYLGGEYQRNQNTEHETTEKFHCMSERAWGFILTVCGGIISGAVGLGAVWLGDYLTRKREKDSSRADRLRKFREDISEIIALLDRVEEKDSFKFNTSTHDQVLTLYARAADDVTNANIGKFASAIANYCDIQENDQKSAAKYIAYINRNPPLNPRAPPMPNQFRDDKRPRKERMLDALNRLKECAK
jgi:hypothetical protein